MIYPPFVLKRVFVERYRKKISKIQMHSAVVVSHLRNLQWHKSGRLVCESKFERTIHRGIETAGNASSKQDYAKPI